jgi:hypothetical protein
VKKKRNLYGSVQLVPGMVELGFDQFHEVIERKAELGLDTSKTRGKCCITHFLRNIEEEEAPYV